MGSALIERTRRRPSSAGVNRITDYADSGSSFYRSDALQSVTVVACCRGATQLAGEALISARRLLFNFARPQHRDLVRSDGIPHRLVGWKLRSRRDSAQDERSSCCDCDYENVHNNPFFLSTCRRRHCIFCASRCAHHRRQRGRVFASACGCLVTEVEGTRSVHKPTVSAA